MRWIELDYSFIRLIPRPRIDTLKFSISPLLRRRPFAREETRSEQQQAHDLVNRGAAAERSGAIGEALECYRRAIRADPSCSSAYMHLASACETSGSADAAIQAYSQMLVIDPQSAVGHYNVGLLHLRADKHAEAQEHFRTALDLKTPFPDAWVGLAGSLEGLGRDEDALEALNNALSEREDYAGALFNAAILLRKLGRHEEAMARDRRGLELEPEHALVHHRLGSDFSRDGRHADAEASYRRALALEPGLVDAQLALASSLHAQGRDSDSLRVIFDVVAQHPDSRQARQCLVRQIDGVTLSAAGASERAVLLQLCLDDNVSMRSITPAIVGLLTNAPGFRLLQRYTELDENPLTDSDADVQALLRDPLLLSALPRIQIADASLERVLTHLRRHVLLRFADRVPSAATASLDLVTTIAGQCFFSGYPFFTADDERARVDAVREIVVAALAVPQIEPRTIEAPLATFAMYEYLDQLVDSDKLLDPRLGPWSPAFQRLLRQQLENRRSERDIATRLPAISAIEDTTSLAVRRQYEEHPYPLWLDVRDVTADTTENTHWRLRAGRGPSTSAQSSRILVAGCGTGEHSIVVAKTYPDSQVLGVDLSRASLAYAARMTKHFGLSNIAYRQGDILALGKLRERFAIIECCGVLHHLRDPLAGWRTLVGLLDEAGVMRIGLYSTKARKEMGVEAARQFVHSRGFTAASEDVRRCRRAILDLPAAHPASTVTTCADFYSCNGCRDLIMHVQEHTFTMRRVAECIAELDLRLLGMECSPETRRRFGVMFPDSASVVDLDAWDRFEDAYPETFKGMYLFWCDKR